MKIHPEIVRRHAAGHERGISEARTRPNRDFDPVIGTNIFVNYGNLSRRLREGT
jgi:hypothetical protein